MFPTLYGAVTGGGGDWWLAGGIDAANAIAAYQPIGAASLAASYVNLANPGTNDAAPGTAPTFSAVTGWGFAAASSTYLLTGITPAPGWSMICRFSGLTDGVNNQWLCGCQNTASNRRFYLLVNAAAANAVVYGAGGAVSVSPDLLAGVLAVAGQQGYRDGVANGGAIGGWTDPPSPPNIIIGALQTQSTVTGHSTCNIQAVAIYDTTITADQVAAVTEAMNAL